MTSYWDPRNYIDRNARVATGDIHPPLPRKIGFVTQSPGDLFLASKGLTSQTKALVTKLRSATEIQTSRNEVIQVRSVQTGQTLVAIDIGESPNAEARDLLVVGEPMTTEPVEEPSAEPSYYEDALPSVDSGPSMSDVLQAHVTQQHAVNEANRQTIENATPSAPTQYIPAPSSYVAPSTYVAPSPAPAPYVPPPPAQTWVSAGAFIVDDYTAYLVGLG